MRVMQQNSVVFYFIGSVVPPYAEYCIRSIRKHNFVRITQLADYKTPSVYGVDEVKRFIPSEEITRNTVNRVGYQFLTEMDINPVMFIDPDMIFNGNIDHLFEGDFDVCVATRAMDDPVTVDYAIKFPWCSMMVVKNPEFWKDCYSTLLGYPEIHWVSNMNAVADILRSDKYKVKVVDGNVYNALPFSYGKDVKIYHYKLSDKSGMIPFFEKYCNKEESNERCNEAYSVL